MLQLRKQNQAKILLILLAVLVSSCVAAKTRPDHHVITVCVSAPSLFGMMCSAGGLPPVLISYDKTDNFIALPPDSSRNIFERLKLCESLE